MELYQNSLNQPCFQVIQPIQLSMISFLILFHHEGLSSFENGIMISKYYRKMMASVNYDFDVNQMVETCLQLSKCFSENVFWSNPKSGIPNKAITPRYSTPVWN